LAHGTWTPFLANAGRGLGGAFLDLNFDDVMRD
jgi:hypothetical protein